MQQFRRGQVFLASGSALVPGLLCWTKTPHLCLSFLSAAPEAWRLECATTPLVSSGQFGSVYSFSNLGATGGEACLLEGTKGEKLTRATS